MRAFILPLAALLFLPLAAAAQVVGETPPPPDPLLVKANDELAKGELDAALADFQELVKKGPADMTFRSKCIEIYMLKHDTKAAIAVCDTFLVTNTKDNFEVFAARAEIRFATRDFAAAASDYATSLVRAEKFGYERWATDPIALRLWIARSLDDKCDKANEDLALHFAGQPRSPDGVIYNDIAFCLLGDETEVQLMHAAEHLGSGNGAATWAEFYLGMKAFVKGKTADALAYLEKAQKLGVKWQYMWEVRMAATARAWMKTD